jgi:hypothetical protein
MDSEFDSGTRYQGTPVRPLEVDGLMESNRQLAAIGRNLNQIARHLNLNLLSI